MECSVPCTVRPLFCAQGRLQHNAGSSPSDSLCFNTSTPLSLQTQQRFLEQETKTEFSGLAYGWEDYIEGVLLPLQPHEAFFKPC